MKIDGSKVGVGAEAEDLAVVDVHRDEGAGQAAELRRARPRRPPGPPCRASVRRLLPATAARSELSGWPWGAPVASTWTRVAPLRPRRRWSYSYSTPGLADLVAGVEVLVARLLELLGADLADVAEEVRAERPLRVVAHEDALDADAGELVPGAPGGSRRARSRPSRLSVTGLAGSSSVCSRISLRICFGSIPATLGDAAQHALALLALVGGSSSAWTWSASAVRLSTSTSPLRSRISPRGAWTLISRTRLFCASLR